jgi:hypothetical protein
MAVNARSNVRALLIGFAVGFVLIPGGFFIYRVVMAIAPSDQTLLTDVAAAQVEGPRLLSLGREAVQATWQRSGHAPVALAGAHSDGSCDLRREQITGDHYVLLNAVIATPDGQFELVAVPLAGDYPVLRLRFAPDEGGGELIVQPTLWEAD